MDHFISVLKGLLCGLGTKYQNGLATHGGGSDCYHEPRPILDIRIWSSPPPLLAFSGVGNSFCHQPRINTNFSAFRDWVNDSSEFVRPRDHSRGGWNSSLVRLQSRTVLDRNGGTWIVRCYSNCLPHPDFELFRRSRRFSRSVRQPLIYSRTYIHQTISLHLGSSIYAITSL